MMALILRAAALRTRRLVVRLPRLFHGTGLEDSFTNEKIRDVIDTITSKMVLILSRFTPERKAVLDALREKLRKRDYLPIRLISTSWQDITEAVSLLARMARFVQNAAF